MAATREALNLTASYRSRLLAIRQATAITVARAWTAIDPQKLDETYATFVSIAAPMVEGAKRQGVTLADGYLAAYVAAETGKPARVNGLDAEPYLTTMDGRSISRALLPPLFTVKAAIGQSRGAETALQMGLARATRTAAWEAMDAPRRALGDLMEAHPSVDGWRRVASANACGACLASMTGDVEASKSRIHLHGSCRCIAEPVVKGVDDRYRRPTGREVFDRLSEAEQAALFHGGGGAEKAALIRSGDVPFEALIARSPMAVTDDQITEAPLSELRNR